jgi:molybdopterin-containing oxidoreductase family membrane subunit
VTTYFRTIDGRSPRFFLLVAVLAVLSVWGMWASWMMFYQGHHITGMNNQVPWGLPIAMAVYFIGLSAGSLVLSAISSVFGQKQYKPFSRIAVYMAVLLIIAALASIILDWGRPDRVIHPFIYFQPRSMFSVNTFLYSMYMVIGVVYLWILFAEKDEWVKPIGILAVVWAVGVHTGTGMIFGFINARELFHSALLGPSFIAAALSSGTALIILLLLATFRYAERPLDDSLIVGLAKYLRIFILVVIYFIFCENVTRSYMPAYYHAEGFLLLHGGQYPLAFWGGLVTVGLVIPAVILFHPRWGQTIGGIVVASVMQVVGVLAERYIIVLPGQDLPLDVLPGKEIVSSPFLDGQFANYAVSLPEIAQAVGISAMVGLAYVIGLKVLALLPQEARDSEG